jgi:Scd6-like Sm domain
MAELNDLLGSGITLISKADIRYDGILFSIDAVEAHIVLQQGNQRCPDFRRWI